MIMRFIFIGLFILLQNIAFAYVKIDYAELENGMRVYVVENHRAPIVNHMLLYKVGGESSPMGLSGGAHFLEHLMFHGTNKVQNITNAIEKNGGVFNATTGNDYTNYFETIPKDKLGLMMELEADRMRNLNIDDDSVNAERAIVAEERRMRIDNNPLIRLTEEMLGAFYRNYYGWQVVGWPEEISLLNKEEAQRLYNTFYYPNNAVLLVTGDITMSEVLPLAKKYYGVIPSGDISSIHRYPLKEPDHITDITLTMHHPDVKKPTVKIWYKAPSIDSSEAFPLKLASIILGNSRKSDFYQKLVLGDQVVDINMNYDPFTNVDGIFEISIIPKDDNINVEPLVTELLDTISNKGIEQKDLERAKKMFKASLVYSSESPTGQAALYSQMIMAGFDVKRIKSQTLEQYIEGINLAQVNSALKKNLYKKHKVIGYLLPQEKENAHGK